MNTEQRQTLRQARLARGETLEDVATAVGANVGTISRVERGQQLPTRELARKLFDHFGGSVELGVIYDPDHKIAS